MQLLLIDKSMFEWVHEVNRILSKTELGIRREGDRIVSDYDVILSHFSSNLSSLYAIPETKLILSAYLRILEKLGSVAKSLFYMLSSVDITKRILIVSGNFREEFFFNSLDKSYYSKKELKYLEDAYHNIMEAFRQIARKYIYTLLAGIQPIIEEAQPETLPQFQQPQQPLGQLYGTSFKPSISYPTTQPTQQPQQFGEVKRNEWR